MLTVPTCVRDTAVTQRDICTLEVLALGTAGDSSLQPCLSTLLVVLVGGIPHTVHRWPPNEFPLHSTAHLSADEQHLVNEPFSSFYYRADPNSQIFTFRLLVVKVSHQCPYPSNSRRCGSRSPNNSCEALSLCLRREQISHGRMEMG